MKLPLKACRKAGTVRSNLVVLGLVFTLLQTVSAATDWTVLQNCRFLSTKYFDADSFHVLCNGKESIFRLYFVDAPEQDYRFDRIYKQAEYFGVGDKRVLAVSHEATAYVRSLLTNNLTIETRWTRAGGQSKLPRYYAVVDVNGKDLAELLVERGFARVFGEKTDYPDGTNKLRIQEKLADMEARAREEAAGIWRYGKKRLNGQTPAWNTLQIGDRN